MLGQGSLAGYARVAFEAQTGEFNSDIRRAEQVYRSSTQGMSSDAIRLELAQDKLRRALAKGPAAFREQARAELNLRQVQDSLRHSTDRLDASQDRANRSMGRFSRGALAGTGLFGGMARSVAFASSAFLGGAGLLFALRSTLNAAKESELVLGQTRTALEQTGLSWEKYEGRIQTVIRAQSKLGFDDEALLKTFGVFIRRTNDVEKALSLNALAVDVARGRYIDLEAAQQIVLKASIGQAGALRRLGLDVKTTATSTQLLTMLTQKYGSAAESASNTATGAQDRFNVSLENAQEVIGRGLLPALTDYLNTGSEYIDQLTESGELQRKVNEAVETGGKVVRGFAGGLRLAKEAAEPLVDALGGVENTVKAITLAWVAFKVKALTGFSLTAAASALTSRKMVADAALAGSAWDVATRPRVMSVTTVGGGVPGAPGAGGRRGIPPILAGNPALVTVAAVLATAGGGTHRGDRSGQYPLTWDAVTRAAQGAATPQEIAILKQELGQYSLANAPDANMARTERRLKRLAASASATAPGHAHGADRHVRPPASDGSGSSGGSARPGRTLADIELDIARPGNEVGDLREKRSFLQRQIDALERRKNLTAAQKSKLAALYGDLASTQSQLDAIATAAEQKIADQREKAAKKREAEREAHDRRMARLQESAAKAAQRRLDLYHKAGLNNANTRAELRRAALRGVDKTGKPKGADEKGLTAADVHRMQFDFLSKLTGEIGSFGSNFASDSGQLATQAHVQTQLMRDSNAALQRMIEGSWHPGAQLASAELSAAGWGVGF